MPGLWVVGEVTRRTERVAELIRQELSRIVVAELNDPRIGFVTITRVEVPSDMRSARVSVSILGSPAEERTALRGLDSARGRIQAQLGEKLELRYVPQITFHRDPGVKHSLRISTLLSEIARDRGTEKADPEILERETGPFTEKAEGNGG